MGWFSREPTPPPLSAEALKRAARRCESQARAYWACVNVATATAAAASAVAAHLAPPPTPSSSAHPPPSACAPLRDGLTHCLCESAFREVADAYAHCAVSAAARGDFSRDACAAQRGVMVRALWAAGLAPALEAPPAPPARHERARATAAARAAATGGA
jgi:hypothetical protein